MVLALDGESVLVLVPRLALVLDCEWVHASVAWSGYVLDCGLGCAWGLELALQWVQSSGVASGW